MLYLVATPIGNLEDITFRAVRVLGDVDLIAAEDTRRAAKLLRRYSIQTPTQSFHEHNEHQRIPTLITMLERGKSVALVTDAGTPILSDPGGQLVKEVLRRNIVVQPVPGASAILSALIISGLAESQFAFVGFPPSRSGARKQWLHSLLLERRPIVLFEAPHRIIKSLGDMLTILGDRQISVSRELTKRNEELVNGPISSVIKHFANPRGEFTIVISPLKEQIEQPTAEQICNDFGRITESGASRRDAVTQIAHDYGLSARDVYQTIEHNKT